MKRLLIVLVLMLAFAWPTKVQAQVIPGIDDLSVGGGSYFADEDETFDTDALFLAAQLDGFDLPMGANTGVGVEVRFPSREGLSVAYTVWSLNRIKVGPIYTGTDLKIWSGNNVNKHKWNFDARIVVAAPLGKIKGYDLSLEIYSLEENRPIAFCFKVGL